MSKQLCALVFTQFVVQGGEGLVLRQSGSLYEAGFRSDSMLKYKVTSTTLHYTCHPPSTLHSYSFQQTLFSQAVINKITKAASEEEANSFYKVECTKFVVVSLFVVVHCWFFVVVICVVWCIVVM